MQTLVLAGAFKQKCLKLLANARVLKIHNAVIPSRFCEESAFSLHDKKQIPRKSGSE